MRSRSSRRRLPPAPATSTADGRPTELVLISPTEHARRVLHECVLDVYWRRAQITARQHAAGIHFRDVYLRAVASRITAPLDGAQATSARGSARRDISEAQLAARDRVAKMLAMMQGKQQQRLLISVAGWNEWASRTQFDDAGTPSRRRLIKTLASALDNISNGLGMS